MERMEQVPTGLKHILKQGSKRLTYHYKIKKREFSSSQEKIASDVLQGSILGSLLFINFINDLPYGINLRANPVICVDDTSVLIAANNWNGPQVN
jgi:hypothetical protein